MHNPLEEKRILLGVTGSIACYKAVDLASKLTQAGARVSVALTSGAARFVTPLTFRAITHRPVVTDIFDPESELAMEHVALAIESDLLVVAPATANVIAKLALGLADDVLTATALATTAPLVVVPAMDANMHAHPALQANLRTLRERGAHVVGPAQGRLASGLMGLGRMEEPETIVGHLRWVLGRGGDLSERHIVVSAGGTQEPIDPVRMVANRSSGKMGYAVAEAATGPGGARDAGSRTHGPGGPTGHRHAAGRDSPGDARRRPAGLLQRGRPCYVGGGGRFPAQECGGPEGEARRGQETGPLRWSRTRTSLRRWAGDVVKVGFAAETEQVEANARAKLASKGLHLIAANDVSAEGSGFGSDTNRVTLLEAGGATEELPLLPKYEVGHRILDRVADLLAKRDAEQAVAGRLSGALAARPGGIAGRCLPGRLQRGCPSQRSLGSFASP